MNRTVNSVLASSIAVLLSACGAQDVDSDQLATKSESSASKRANEICLEALPTAREYDERAELVRSHPASGASFARFESRERGPGAPRGTAQTRAAGPESFLALCYYAGTFGGFPQPRPPGGGERPEPHDLLGLTVDEAGKTTFFVGGRARSLDIDDGPESN